MDVVALGGLTLTGMGTIFAGWQVYIALRDRATDGKKLQTLSENDSPLAAAPTPSLKKIIVGCFPYPPLMNWNRARASVLVPEFDGPWVHLIHSLADRMAFAPDIRVQSAVTFADANATEAEVVLGLFKTDHRSRVFDFSKPIHRIGLQGVCKAALPSVTKDDLVRGDLKIVVQEGEVGWEYVMNEFKRAATKKNVYQIKSIATVEALDLLICGRYDIAIADEVSCMQFLWGIGAAQPLRLAFDRPLQIFDCCLAAKKSLQWNMDDVDEHLLAIRNDPAFLEGEVQSLRGFEHVIERCRLQ